MVSRISLKQVNANNFLKLQIFPHIFKYGPRGFQHYKPRDPSNAYKQIQLSPREPLQSKKSILLNGISSAPTPTTAKV